MSHLSANLIAHYKMNENTASDNDELVTNGDFAAWTADNPDGWTIEGESGNDPEISEAATGEAHVNTPTLGGGMCNFYTTGVSLTIYQLVEGLTIGRRYRFSITLDTVTTEWFIVKEHAHTQWATFYPGSAGIYTRTFVATHTDLRIMVTDGGLAADITIDDISVKLCAIEDSSGNDHDGLAQRDTGGTGGSDSIHRAGKINGAFDFDGSAGLKDYIEIADHDDFSPGNSTVGSGTPFSISSWVNMHNAAYFVWAGKYGSNEEWLLFTGTAKTIHFRMYDKSAGAYIGRAYGTSLASYENQWTHFVATSDGGILSSGLRLYINKVRVDDTDSESNPGSFVAVENLDQAVWIGRYDTKYANGLIDNVMFFNKELTPLEVSQLYMGGHGTEVLNMKRWGWCR